MELNPVSPSDSRTMVTGMAKSHGNFQRLVQRHQRSIDEVEKITLPQWNGSGERTQVHTTLASKIGAPEPNEVKI